VRCPVPTTIIVFILLLIPTLSSGYYRSDDSPPTAPPVPGRVVVGLEAETPLSLSAGKPGRPVIGMESLDVVGRRHGISRAQFLFPPEKRRSLPAGLSNVLVLDVPDGADPHEIAADLERLPEVAYALPDYPVELYDVPDDPLYLHQWALNNTGQAHYHIDRSTGQHILVLDTGIVDADIDAHEVYGNPPDNTTTVVVAVIDTGVDMDHPDLAGRIWVNAGEIPDNGVDDDHNGYVDDVHGWDYGSDLEDLHDPEIPFPPPDNDPTDEYGHGTHCAGIIASVTNNAQGVAGVVDDCRIMVLDFYPVMLLSYGAQAIVYAADNGADVISMSWGAAWPAPFVDEAIQYARSKGVVLCAAAGNDGREMYNYPASYDGIITVGATTSDDEVGYFSTYSTHLNVCAPGLAILSLRADTTDMYAEDGYPDVHIIDDTYYLASGTSMACPHVAAVAAYIRAVSPGLTPDQTEEVLELTAEDYIDPFGSGDNLPGWDIYSGYGRVNLQDALDAVPDLRAKITSPLPNAISSGTVEIEGIADGGEFTGYILEYGSGSTPAEWIEIVASATPVTNAILGLWNTDGLNGRYTIRLRVGETNMSQVTLIIANMAEVAMTVPAENDTIINCSIITGTAICPNFDYYVMDYGEGPSPVEWHELTRGSVPVIDNQLFLWKWDEGEISEGWYTLRLSVFSIDGLEGSDSAFVYVVPLFSTEDAWKVNYPNNITLIPNYADIDNDGANEILIGSDGKLDFVNSDGSPKLTGIPDIPSYDFRMPAAVGNLDDDGVDDFVAIGVHSTSLAVLFGFPSDSGFPDFQTNLPAVPALDALFLGAEQDQPYVALDDLDSDGRDEILYYSGIGYRGFFVYDSDGTLLIEIPRGFHCYQAADLDGDGVSEIYAASNVLCEYDMSGVLQDNFDLIHTVYPLNPPERFYTTGLSAFDIDGDMKDELIVLAAADYSYLDDSFRIFAFDENLELKDGWPHNTEISNYLVPSSPIFCDLDNDGSLEYISTVWELSSGQVHAWRIDGTPYNSYTSSGYFTATPNPATLHPPVIAELDGDGFPDILTFATTDAFRTHEIHRLVAWDKDGEVLASWPGWPIAVEPDPIFLGIPNFTPVVGDINGDNMTDLIVTDVNCNLSFINFKETEFDTANTPVTHWRYNRSFSNNGSKRILAARIDSPDGNHFLTGTVEITGSAYGEDFSGYAVEFGVGREPTEWTDITSSSAPVRSGLLAQWDTSGLNGYYTIRLRIGKLTRLRTVLVANAPIAAFSKPDPYDTLHVSPLSDSLHVSGSALCPDFDKYELYYGAGIFNGPQTKILNGYSPVFDEQICNWHMNLPGGYYTLYLLLYSDTGLVAEDSVPIYLQAVDYTDCGWKLYSYYEPTGFPNYGDFDGDGENEIVLGTSAGLKFLNVNGTPKTAGMPVILHDCRVPAVVGNLDGDDIDDLALVRYDRVETFTSSGSSKKIRVPVPYLSALYSTEEHLYPYVFLEDVDDDGIDEIHYFRGDGSQSVIIMCPDGSKAPWLITNDPIYAYCAADLSGDGKSEAYVANWRLYQYNIKDSLTGFDSVQSVNLSIDSAVLFNAISLSAVDIDNDQQRDLIVFGRYYEPPAGHFLPTYWVNAFGAGLSPKAGWPQNTGILSFQNASPPVFTDIDKDGSLEYFITANSAVYAYNIDGTPYAENIVFASLPGSATLFTPVAADMDADGYPDLIAHARANSPDADNFETLVAWNRDGQILDGWPIVVEPSGTTANNLLQTRHTPAIGDIDGDGFADLLTISACNDLMFMKFEAVPLSPGSTPVPSWRYNRRMNNIAPLPDSGATSVEDDRKTVIPGAFSLSQNYPNPFNTATAITFSLSRKSDVTLDIYNILGRKVVTLIDRELQAGEHRVEWDGTSVDGSTVASGIYFYRLQATESSAVRKMLLLR
jgi:subtilisin family serine protease